MAREQRVSEAFLDLADTLQPEFDIAEFLHRLARSAVDLVGAEAARVILADNHGCLKVVASLTPNGGELPDPQHVDGPGPQAYRCGTPVGGRDLDAELQQFPDFASLARAAGFRSAHAWPLRHKKQVIGAIEVYRITPGAYSETDAKIVENLTSLATIIVLRERRQQHADTLAAQLQQALDSRLVIEQAKGILAERTRLGVDQAFVLLRGHARRHQMRLAALAAQVIDGTVDAGLIAAGESAIQRRRNGSTSHRRGAGVPQRRASAG